MEPSVSPELEEESIIMIYAGSWRSLCTPGMWGFPEKKRPFLLLWREFISGFIEERYEIYLTSFREKRLRPLHPCCVRLVMKQASSLKWLATTWLRDWWNIMPHISFLTRELDTSCWLDYLFGYEEKSHFTFSWWHFSWQTPLYISHICQQRLVSFK